MTRVVSLSAQQRRPVACRDTDSSALRAIAQAAVNVELFTVPLYMGTLYSIQGMHQISGKGNAFYKNRLWPGPATTAHPVTPNERAFNLIFSVFIEEMLHLQLAANIASAIGVAPIFTSPALQNDCHGWTCYGPDKSVIPHIVDLRDTIPYRDVSVNIAALSAAQVNLFKAIEAPEKSARDNIDKSARGKYFPAAPFNDWAPKKTEKDLPMFGTIGWMYQCYYDYMNLHYDDGTNLWQHVFQPGSQQNDLFNIEKPGHSMREYLGFETTLTASDAAGALKQAVTMMNAITDQGEGSELKERVELADLLAVQSRYQASCKALEADYPRYTDTGEPAASADAVARYENGRFDHYERFTQLGELVGEVETWPTWHDKHGPWTAEDLETAQYRPEDHDRGLPSTQAIAEAMNRMADHNSCETMHALVSKAVVGSIAGVTTVLNKYWAKRDGKKPPVSFPYPSMAGSGDRMAICWALFGKAPNLSLDVGNVDSHALSHACQGLDFQGQGRNACAEIGIFHTCRGSNDCKAQGGCGFVQKTTGGGLCGFAVVAAKTDSDSTAGDDGPFSAPGDNKCATFGGCAVPISASQVLPRDGIMELFDFVGQNHKSQPIVTMSFTTGEKVHDVAYRAYLTVMKHRNPPVKPPTDPPPPNDLRLVFPPST